ncbi:YhjD/YihY/BrkB family envelope integrity protein [Streptomyces lunaelactis]|uniref:YhjD/YihY/BrkB family envelope integrity protein n=1 Tax=Streptomyces lunaelactis TaxID=1535768 RepID=UPI002814CA05|nr:YhjD/YihY/BrkB family envelope integrity protein [Streptomyces lunaelactis]
MHDRDDDAGGASMRQSARRLAKAVQSLRTRLPFVSRAAEQLLRVSILDNGTRIAAQVFVGVIPALFVITAFAPAVMRDQLVSTVRAEFGLRGETLSQVQQLLRAGGDSETRDAFGAVGAVVVLLSATTCSRALQRVCERSWHLPGAAIHVVAWRWMVWLVVWLVVLLLLGPLHDAFGAGTALGVPLTVVSSVLLWWWTQYLLLGGRVPWLPLLPGAVMSGTAVVVLSWAARLYLPNELDRSVAQFGPYGAVFSLLSWLIVLCAAVTAAIALGQVVATEPFVARLLGTATRNSDPDRSGPDQD